MIIMGWFEKAQMGKSVTTRITTNRVYHWNTPHQFNFVLFGVRARTYLLHSSSCTRTNIASEERKEKENCSAIHNVTNMHTVTKDLMTSQNYYFQEWFWCWSNFLPMGEGNSKRYLSSLECMHYIVTISNQPVSPHCMCVNLFFFLWWRESLLVRTYFTFEINF